MLSKNTRLKFELDTLPVDGIIDWDNIEVYITYNNDAVQANISIQEFKFVGPALQLIISKINNIFHGIPIKITAYNDQNNLVAFDGHVNLSDGAVWTNDPYGESSVDVKIVKAQSLNSVENRISGVTFTLLNSLGHISQNDIEYLIEEVNQYLQIAITSLGLFSMAKTLADKIKDISDVIKDGTAHSAGGVTGPAAGAIWIAATIIITVAYTIALGIAIINMVKTLLEMFISSVRKHKTCSFLQLFEGISNYLGMTFVTGIPELEFYSYLPSNNEVDEMDISTGFIATKRSLPYGFPNVSDPGYQCVEFIDIAKKMFNARVTVHGNELHFRNINDPFYLANSSYTLPDVHEEVYEYNTSDFIANRLVRFQYDGSDTWTIDEDKDISIQIATDAITTPDDQAKYMGKLEEIVFPLALGNRKSKLRALERILKSFAGVVDKVTSKFGSGTNYKNKIQNRVGMLMVSNNNHRLAKVLYIKNGKIPVNHRDLCSARYLYEKYLYQKSFVSDGFAAQRKVVRGTVPVGFGLENFIQVAENRHTTNGERIEKITWHMFDDSALIDYSYPYVYTTNLKDSEI